MELNLGITKSVLNHVFRGVRGGFQTRKKSVFAYQIGNKGASQSLSKCVILSVNEG